MCVRERLSLSAYQLPGNKKVRKWNKCRHQHDKSSEQSAIWWNSWVSALLTACSEFKAVSVTAVWHSSQKSWGWISDPLVTTVSNLNSVTTLFFYIYMCGCKRWEKIGFEAIWEGSKETEIDHIECHKHNTIMQMTENAVGHNPTHY